MSLSPSISLMAPSGHVKIVEQCRVSPLPTSGSAPPTSSLPLTFFDIPWLFFSPSQPLFFYEFPSISISQFTSTTLPLLKHSLSLTLHHFYPLAGHLFAPSQPPAKPEMVFSCHDSVLLTTALSSSSFIHLSSNQPRYAHQLKPLVPERELLPTDVSRNQETSLPLLSIQITVFPNSGMCIGFSLLHVAADQRTFNLFLKTWASICRAESQGKDDLSVLPLKSLPCFDRSVIKDPKGLESIFLEQMWSRSSSSLPRHIIKHNFYSDNVKDDSVRATFIVSLADMERIKQWIIVRCNKTNQSLPVRLSSYVLTCAFIWVCLIKAQQYRNDKGYSLSPVIRRPVSEPITVWSSQQPISQLDLQLLERNCSTPEPIALWGSQQSVSQLDVQLLEKNYCTPEPIALWDVQLLEKNRSTLEDPIYFGFIAGGITRLNYTVPNTYFGNCIAFNRSKALESELIGENGIVVAAKAVAETIAESDDDVLGGAERWISDWEVLFGSELHVMVTGSPKVDLYETDFGWGRPKKVEEISIYNSGAISFNESRDLKGGIEVGLLLPHPLMVVFTSLFNDGLKSLQ